MTLQDKIKELVLPAIEGIAKEQINAHSDEVVDMLLKKLQELIPGHIEDAFIALEGPKLKLSVKEFLLSQADKIS